MHWSQQRKEGAGQTGCGSAAQAALIMFEKVIEAARAAKERVVLMENALRGLRDEQAIQRRLAERGQMADLMQGRLFGAPGEGLGGMGMHAGGLGMGIGTMGDHGQSGRAHDMMMGYEMAVGAQMD